jgi:hypothetical protein
MGQSFWVAVAISYIGIVLLGVVNVGAFVLRYRAGRNPPRSQLVRGVMILAVFLVFPRLLPHTWLWTVVLAALLLWEVATWFKRAANHGKKTRPVPVIDNRPHLTNGLG